MFSPLQGSELFCSCAICVGSTRSEWSSVSVAATARTQAMAAAMGYFHILRLDMRRLASRWPSAGLPLKCLSRQFSPFLIYVNGASHRALHQVY